MKELLNIIYFLFKAVTSFTLGFIVLLYYFYLKFKYRNEPVLTEKTAFKVEAARQAYSKFLSLDLTEAYLKEFTNKL